MVNKNTKERLLEAALDLFSEKGYNATSIDEIAEAVGIKGPSVYKYFKSKENLILELSEICDTAYRNSMALNSRRIDINSAREFKEFSLGNIRFTIVTDKVRKLRKMMTIEQFRDERFSRNATKYQYDNINGMFTGIFADLIKKGMVEDHDPEQLALMYYSPVSVMIQICDREPERIDECMKKIEDNIDLFIDKFFIKK
ncbi:MAG: TetR/AcrR family transcriptional regulator [Ruminococcus sp.]|nr:TetR/AcrR family transcriptional regulator [Ruminococcus sp.]MBQ1431467.1 TetR/AcrR family transcriptional regulator [Ruminococcus sp.]